MFGLVGWRGTSRPASVMQDRVRDGVRMPACGIIGVFETTVPR